MCWGNKHKGVRGTSLIGALSAREHYQLRGGIELLLKFVEKRNFKTYYSNSNFITCRW